MRNTVFLIGGMKSGYYTTWTHRITTRTPADVTKLPVSEYDRCEIKQD